LRTRCKICGINTLEAAVAASEAGADALGFVFHAPSPRAVTPATVASILRGCAPFVTRVGLFVNAEAAAIAAVLGEVRLDVLQFHGDEPESFCLQFGLPYIRAIGMREDFDIRTALDEFPRASALLLDTHDPLLHGGTGRSFDWSRFPASCGRPLILAGGLTPENVGKAIRLTRPYAVDVSGGVESQRGIKSIAKIHAFVREVINERASQT